MLSVRAGWYVVCRKSKGGHSPEIAVYWRRNGECDVRKRPNLVRIWTEFCTLSLSLRQSLVYIKT